MASTAQRSTPRGRPAVSWGRFRIGSDDHFTIKGRLADGTAVGGEFGYVTNGMAGERACFVVLPEGKVEFWQSNQIGPY
ncbi:MAG TPA: hypothetical protein VEL76_02615 [Gemmataceae bacterium]|nr:hypothetical protein [Gemmataceae bacterium]